MRHILHLLKKDLRCLWPPLTVLYLLLLVSVMLALQDPLTYEGIRQHGLLSILLVFAVLLTVGMLVHQEPLVGTTAFWLTRPIRRSSLLLEKVVFLLAFVITPPILATMGVLLVYGIEPERYGVAVFDILIYSAPFVVAGFVLAAVTPNVPAYFLAWIAAFIAVVFADDVIGFFGVAPTMISRFSRTVAFCGAVSFLGSLAVIHQYLTRRTRHSLLGIGIGFLATVLTPTFWPWEIAWALDPFMDSERIALRLPDPEKGAFPAERTSQGVRIEAVPVFSEELPGYDLEITSTRGDLEVDGGRRVPVNATVSFLLYGGAIDRALDGYRWVGRTPSGARVFLGTPGSARLEDIVGRTHGLSARVHGRAYRYRLAGAIKPTVGARFQKGATFAIVHRVERGDLELHVSLRQRQILYHLGESKFPRVLLVNRPRREMIPGRRRNNFTRSRSVFLVPLVLGRERTLMFPLEFGEGKEITRIDDDWLASSELFFLEQVPVGRYETTLRIEEFTVRDAGFDRQELSTPTFE